MDLGKQPETSKPTKITSWTSLGKTGAEILSMPNIPFPLHLQAPRTILGTATWNRIRKACYEKAGNRCEICGADCNEVGHHAHELYSINYETQTSVFDRAICLCPTCHVRPGVHTGRALTMFRKGSALMTRQTILDGAEHVYSLVSKWNNEHPNREPVKLFDTWADIEKEPELHDAMAELRKKYGIEFYSISGKWFNKKNWPKWKLVIGNKIYYTQFENHLAWEKAMENNNSKRAAEHTNPFKGSAYDSVDSFLKEEGK